MLNKAQYEHYKKTEGPLGDYCREFGDIMEELDQAKAKLINLYRKHGIELPEGIRLREIAVDYKEELAELERRLAERQGVRV